MSFGNPIVGREDLLRTAIRSPNFITGVSGWRIAQDGSAEFNNVVVRGTLQSSNFVAGVAGWRLQPTGGAQLDSVDLLGSLTLIGGGKIRTAGAGLLRAELSAGAQNSIFLYTGDGSETAPGRIVHTVGAGASRRILVQLESGSLTAANPTRVNLWSESANGVTPALLELIPRGKLAIGADLVEITRIGAETADTGLMMMNSWIRIIGDRGLFWQDHGGGWFMDNSTWGPQSYSGKQVRADPAAFGSSPAYGTAYAWFGHKDFTAAGQYALMQGNVGDTYLNAASGRIISMRINNSQIAAVVAGYDRFEAQSASDADDWDQRAIRITQPTRPGIAGYLSSGGPAAYQMTQQGAGWDSLDSIGNFRPYRASAFTVISRRATKIPGSIAPLDRRSERDRLQRLNPVRFRRPHGAICALCNGAGCDNCSADGIPGQINRPWIDMNDDTDFVGFIAEEVAEVYPEVIGWEPSVPDDWYSEPRPAGIDLGAMVAVVVAAQQEMLERLEALEQGGGPR